MKKITKREIEVLDLISKGFTSKEIADLLYISPETVMTHRTHLLNKMRVKNTALMIRKGFETGLLSLQPHMRLQVAI